MPNATDPRTSYIAIATRCFAANGYHGTSLAAVAREAGVSKQALLHFFGTKEKLYKAVLEALAARQSAAIEATAERDPAAHLRAYFLLFRDHAMADAQDMRLIVRALLDSAATARAWPMKPYLDRLIALAEATPGGQGQDPATILAWLSHLIGTTQYAAISATALGGMYGPDIADTVAARGRAALLRDIDTFVA